MKSFLNRNRYQVAVLAAIVCVIACVATPTFKKARQQAQAQIAITQLRKIATAKQEFARHNHLDYGAIVDDAHALVPTYLDSWPTSPPVHAVYAANSIGVEPTVNGATESEIVNQCWTTDVGCSF